MTSFLVKISVDFRGFVCLYSLQKSPMGKHTGGIPFAALKEIKGRFSTLFATQKGDCREAIAFLRGNMKQEKHEIRCSEIEKHLGKCCFFEKSYKNTRTKNESVP